MKSYTFEPTSNPDLRRVVDLKGDWRHYFHSPSGTYLRAVNAILEEGYAKGARFHAYLKTHTPEEIDRILKEAGDKGDAVHQFISMIFSHPKMPNLQTPIMDNGDLRLLTHDEWSAVLSFQNFWNAHKPVLIDFEQAIANVKLGYAGTYDARLKLTGFCGNDKCQCKRFIGKVGLFDWKTGGGIYSNHGAQLSAYEKIAPAHYTAIVRLGTKHRVGYEFQIYNRRETNAHFREFRSAITIASVDYKPFDPKKEIYEIPETLSLTVERAEKQERSNIIQFPKEA